MTYDKTATYVLAIYEGGIEVFGPNADAERTAEVISACKNANSFDDMPTAPVDEAEAVVAAYADENDIDCLDAEYVGVCRVGE